jgi:O-antigen/teichoic acid export membrane protein
VGNHFRGQAAINLGQSLLLAVLVVIAALTGAGIWTVMLIYLAGKIILGLGPLVLALRWLPQMLGAGWWRAPLALLPERRKLAGFALNTNFSGTINVLARDSEQLWISFLFSPVEAGYFKVALSLINPIVMPVTPFISTTFPEITRAAALREWARLRSLLRRVTLLAAAWTAAVGVGLLAVGRPLLFSDWRLFGRSFHIFRAEFSPAFPILMILLAGYGVANILFWNRTLLLALGQASYPFRVGLVTTLIKVALTILLVPTYGYLMEAALLSLYFIVSVGLTTWRGLALVRAREQSPGAEAT